MDFSLNVDPSLHSYFMPSSSSLEFLTQHDFDLAGSPSSNVFQTVHPSQLIEMSSSPSPSTSPSATSPSYSSCDSSFGSTSSPPPSQTRSRKRNGIDDNKENDDHAGHAKRHQTKLACSWCRKLSKKCDAQRPCGRCVQFNRCSECVDAPPRKPRAKGVDRGTYKKTRELATKDYQEAVARRAAYVAKQAKKGRDIRVGLTPDEILERQIKSEAAEARKMEACKMDVQKMLNPLPLMGDDIQGVSLPFTGPLEDLFTCSASPEIEELLFTPSASVSTLSSKQSSAQSSPLFEVLSPMTDSTTMTDPDSFISWEWQTMENFPIVMELVAAAQAAENSSLFDDAEEIQPWSDYALEA
jgi:hypothetical protein